RGVEWDCLSRYFDLSLIAQFAGAQTGTRFRQADRRGFDALRLFDSLDVYSDLFQTRGDLGGRALLVAPAQVFSQELFARGAHRQIVHGTGKAVAFVRRDDVFDREVAFAQRHHNLIRLGLLDARIVRALYHEQRRFDLVRRIERRLANQPRLAFRRRGVAHSLGEDFAERFPVRRNRFEQRDQVRRADYRNRRRVNVGRERDAGQRRVTAIRPAHNPDALRIGDAFRDQVFDAPRDVVLLLVAPLVVSGVEEFLAVSGRASEIRLQHGVTTVGEELRERVVAPRIAVPRPAVREHDQRQVLRFDSLRQRQEGGYFEAVGRLVADRLHLGQTLARQLLADVVLQRQLLRLAVEEIVLAGFDVARGADQPERLILGRRAEVDVFVRQALFQQFVISLERFVAPVNPRAFVFVGRCDQLVGHLRKDRRAEIVAIHRVGFDQFFFAGFRIEQDKARQINLLALVRDHIDALAVLMKLRRITCLEDVA